MLQAYEIKDMVDKGLKRVTDAIDRHTRSQVAISEGLTNVAEAIREHTAALKDLADMDGIEVEVTDEIDDDRDHGDGHGG